jgi:hypothetical protein
MSLIIGILKIDSGRCALRIAEIGLSFLFSIDEPAEIG